MHGRPEARCVPYVETAATSLALSQSESESESESEPASEFFARAAPGALRELCALGSLQLNPLSRGALPGIAGCTTVEP